ncbi:MAG: CvpA family protein [Chloroflexi bacterium]|nr:CvpA family protein [Chloroflexota bacterium]MDA0244909.1 CvpA family protein [Chloroflexota bacterium]
MVSLQWIFYMMIIFFALVGSLRGWQREVLALTGLIASIAALNQFGYAFINNLVNGFTFTETPLDSTQLEQAFFRAQLIFHCTIAFFSYQVVAKLAEGVAGNRFGDRMREGFQRRFIGAILGAVNGYLVIGGIWSFLEFQLTPTGYVQRALNTPYPFDANLIVRPLMDATNMGVVQYLPLALIGPNLWLLFFFVAFFIVIIALI